MNIGSDATHGTGSPGTDPICSGTCDTHEHADKRAEEGVHDPRLESRASFRVRDLKARI